MYKILEYINLPRIIIFAIIISVICACAGIGTRFFTRIVIVCSCGAGIGFACFLLWDTWQKKNIEIYREPLPRKSSNPIVFNILENSAAIPENLLELAGIDRGCRVNRVAGHTGASQSSFLLDTVIDLDCLMVWGGRGAGKTNFLQHLAQAKVMRGEELWIIDPKPSKPGKWPQGVNVIGHGHDYQSISAISEKYDFELECRKAQFQNVASFPKVTLIVDELYLLNLKIKGFIDMILPLLLEGREYNIHMTLISQSKTAGSLGLKGRYDLLECFDAIVGLERMGPKHDPNSYHAVVDLGKGDIEHIPPGKYFPGKPRYQNPQNYNAFHEPDYEDPDIININQIGYNPRPDLSTDKRQAIYECIYQAGRPLTPNEIQDMTGLKGGYLRKALTRMHKAGHIIKTGRGLYDVPLDV